MRTITFRAGQGRAGLRLGGDGGKRGGKIYPAGDWMILCPSGCTSALQTPRIYIQPLSPSGPRGPLIGRSTLPGIWARMGASRMKGLSGGGESMRGICMVAGFLAVNAKFAWLRPFSLDVLYRPYLRLLCCTALFCPIKNKRKEPDILFARETFMPK